MPRAVFVLVALVVSGCVGAGCHRGPREEQRASGAPPTPPPAPPPPPPPMMEEVAVAGDLPAYALRNGRAHGRLYVFLAGMCAHPLGYTQSFQWAAAARGDLVAVQGDVPCSSDGALRRWSSDLIGTSRRIDAAIRAAGLDATREIVLIGYSQGAERSEHLAARWPDRYTRAVLIAGPIVPSPERLGRLRGAVLMAGDRDLQQPMLEGRRRLAAARVPALFVSLPGARHGDMGQTPEANMATAFDFLDQVPPSSPVAAP